MTYREVLPIWWSMTWRSFIFGTVAGFIAGAIAGLAAGMLGHPEAGGLWGSIAGGLVAIPVSLWAMRAAINKHEFRPAQTQHS
ncbi:hypothetical protein G7044_00795 [Paracoccus sp. 12-3]|nr:hypothetical protein [Paracoccus xiamenensis]